MPDTTLMVEKSRLLAVGSDVWVFCGAWYRGTIIARIKAMNGVREAMVKVTMSERVRTVRRPLVELMPIEAFDRDQDRTYGAESKVEAVLLADRWWKEHGGLPA